MSRKRTYIEAFNEISLTEHEIQQIHSVEPSSEPSLEPSIEPPIKKRKLRHQKQNKMGNGGLLEQIGFKKYIKVHWFQFCLDKLQLDRSKCPFTDVILLLIFDMVYNAHPRLPVYNKNIGFKHEHYYPANENLTIYQDQNKRFNRLGFNKVFTNRFAFYTSFYVTILRNIWSLSIGFATVKDSMTSTKYKYDYFCDTNYVQNGECKGVVIWSNFLSGLNETKSIKVDYYDALTDNTQKQINVNSKRFYLGFMFSYGEMKITINNVKLSKSIKICRDSFEYKNPFFLIENVKIEQII